VHSYTPTLTALVDAHAKYTRLQKAKKETTITAIGVPELPGRPDKSLPHVIQELENIASAVGKEKVFPIVGPNATIEQVFSALLSCKWLHLACHGEQNIKNALESNLCLYDGELQLEKILKTYIPDAEFVFLSACETAMGDAELINESMHLAAAMIFAGFCGAIGSLWSIVDGDGPPLAHIIYKRAVQKDGTLDVFKVSYALHKARQAMRRKGLPIYRWAPFVHLGV